MVKSDNRKPLQKTEIILKELGSETLLYNPQTKAVHILNKTSLLIWELCDGGHDFLMIEEALKQKFNVDGSTNLTADIEKTISQFNELGLIKC